MTGPLCCILCKRVAEGLNHLLWRYDFLMQASMISLRRSTFLSLALKVAGRWLRILSSIHPLIKGDFCGRWVHTILWRLYGEGVLLAMFSPC